MMILPVILVFLTHSFLVETHAVPSSQPLSTGSLNQMLLEKGSDLQQPSPDVGLGRASETWPLPTPVSTPGPRELPASLAKSRRKRKMSVTRKGEEWERDCRLRSLQLRVQDLGLGYESDEIVLFKYCSGNCPKARTNHDLTLSLLLRKPDLPNLSQEKIISDPCCRPTQFKDVTFLDVNNRWHTVEKLAASQCSCIG